ncbi:MAG: Gfo/Idh/MocA family oxidoreductase [Chloroflexota bacterium]
MTKSVSNKRVRVAFYGTGHWVQTVHIPNLFQIDNVDIVALCDTNQQALDAAAAILGPGSAQTFTDGHEMLAAKEILGEIDVLFSCVPAFARTDVEIAAAHKGIAIFSEKPQALELKTAQAIDAAIQAAGVLSTVGTRERYRPLLQAIRHFLADKEIIHVQCSLPRSDAGGSWVRDEDRSGGYALDWGQHAVDYVRFMTGENITTAQAFYMRPAAESFSLASSFNFQLTNGASMALTFVNYLAEGEVKAGRSNLPLFTIYYRGGRLDIYREGRDRWSYEHNGEAVIDREVFDPWLAQDRAFIEAVRTGDDRAVLNDYHDGLYSLAPILAGWASAQNGGIPIQLGAFMA